MRRAYYDNTGIITLVVPEKIAPAIDNPYVLINNTTNVNEYKINLETRELERLPEEQIPKQINR